ncbi:hypothetical protein VcTj87_10810 [Vibrio comitans]
MNDAEVGLGPFTADIKKGQRYYGWPKIEIFIGLTIQQALKNQL